MKNKYTFDGWVVDNELNRLVKSDEIRLEPKVMEVLLFLIKHQGETVSKEDLIKEVWQDVIVVDKSINRIISVLRKSLNDDVKNPKYIETISKKGYRFICPVNIVGDKEVQPDMVVRVSDSKNRIHDKSRKGIWILAISLLIIILASIVFWNSDPTKKLVEEPIVSTFFKTPSGTDVAVDKLGNVYVSNSTAEIRKIDKDGSSDSVFLSGSTLGRSTGLTFSPDGEILYVACRPKHKMGWITKVYPNGRDEIFVNDLHSPGDITVDGIGNLFVSEMNGSIKKITPNGVVKNYVSLPSVNTPLGIAWTPGDTLYVSSAHDGNIYKIIPDTIPIVEFFAHVDGVENQFGCGYMIYFAEHLYITNGDNRIHKISKQGEVTTFAGSGIRGEVNGAASVAQFNAPNGIGVNKLGTRIYITEWHRSRVRLIELQKD